MSEDTRAHTQGHNRSPFLVCDKKQERVVMTIHYRGGAAPSHKVRSKPIFSNVTPRTKWRPLGLKPPTSCLGVSQQLD